MSTDNNQPLTVDSIFDEVVSFMFSEQNCEPELKRQVAIIAASRFTVQVWESYHSRLDKVLALSFAEFYWSCFQNMKAEAIENKANE